MVFKYRLAEILLKLALNTNHAINQLINQSTIACCVFSDVSIESENALLHDLNIFINKMKTNVIKKLVIHKQEEEML